VKGGNLYVRRNASAVFDSDVSLTTGSNAGSAAISIGTNSVTTRIFGNRITSSAIGVLFASGGNQSGFAVLCNTIYTTAGFAVSLSNTGQSGVICFNTIPGGTTNGIDIVTGNTALNFIVGNMVTDNGGIGVDFNSTAVAAFVGYNRTRDNTGGAYDPVTDWLTATNYGAVTSGSGSSSDYADFGAQDYNLIDASPAVEAGIPAFASIGALQPEATGAAGMLFIPDLSGT